MIVAHALTVGEWATAFVVLALFFGIGFAFVCDTVIFSRDQELDELWDDEELVQDCFGDTLEQVRSLPEIVA